ncbi:TetR/AcrR family transcriptional regulator [Nocardioides soli]|uniref:AcrR family transcriptional regulator n=1 Tax=Nocardioides soli TaxID=1036020 RepID=A0A7W4VZI6_9ACTN|nr:TetR/AcrR family transcriptional regulator [Nocardioides soli]MBB3044187.1 AcrR family transcriptional regulator [Nocardioides soli]
MEKRRRRDRSETDPLVFEAVRRILVRDGVLAGFTLQTVADEAGVNRVQIYQNFGTKQALLRAAILDILTRTREERDAHQELPFPQRRRKIFEQFLQNPDVVRLEALLAQDGDAEFTVFPWLAEAQETLERDRREGAIPHDADALMLHVLTAATYMGYCIFREAYARDTGLTPEALDERILDTFGDVLKRLVQAEPAEEIS